MPGYARPTMVSTSNEVVVTPVGNISSTILQGAIQELDSEKASIPIFASEEERNAAFPTPPLAQIIYRSDLGTYQGYNGTAWVAIGGGGSSDLTPILLMGA